MWLAAEIDNPLATPPSGETGWEYHDLDWLRVWHTQPVLASHAGTCRVLVLGHTTATPRDVELAAHALSRGADTALSILGGSATVIAVRPDDALICGDLAGQHLVAHTATSRGVVAGGSPRLLARVTGAELDSRWLAIQLAALPAADVWWAGSPFADVTVVHPGSALCLRRAGEAGSRQVTRLSAPTSNLAQAAEELREALTTAVQSRASQGCSVDLSGGMDSSTIAALTATHSRADQVAAMTLTDSGNDDARTARAIADELPALDQRELATPADILPFGDLDLLGRCDEPISAAGSVASEHWYTRLILDQLGSRRHLTGEGGDAVLSAPLSYLADLGGLAQWQQSAAWARLRHGSPIAVYRAARRLASTSYRSALHAYADHLTTKGRGGTRCDQRVSWLGAPTAALLTSSARATAAQALREHAETQPSPATPLAAGSEIGDVSAWLRMIVLGRQLRGFTQLAADAGLAVESPLLDDAVIRACWSTPATERTSAYRLKPLLAAAMCGIVPDAGLTRSTKGDFTALHYDGLRHHHDQLRAMFTDSRSAALGLVDEAAVQVMLDHAAAGRPIPLGHLDTVVSVEAWLRHQGEHQS